MNNRDSLSSARSCILSPQLWTCYPKNLYQKYSKVNWAFSLLMRLCIQVYMDIAVVPSEAHEGVSVLFPPLCIQAVHDGVL